MDGDMVGAEKSNSSAMHVSTSFASFRHSTSHSVPPLKHKDPGISTEFLPSPFSSSIPSQISLISSST